MIMFGVNILKDYISQRTLDLAEYIIENKATVREAAKAFGISKSTVHKDVTMRLKYINYSLYSSLKKHLETNKSLRHIRGGEATKQKYAKLNKTK